MARISFHFFFFSIHCLCTIRYPLNSADSFLFFSFSSWPIFEKEILINVENILHYYACRHTESLSPEDVLL
ncbi:MAG: hypothetical protein AYK18_01880 [Theionarchaea archaeon DG-70]|nr:MAG: hypothetical protein AYK18_01880 [Theionarchaea archaeon DG-70]